MMVNEKNNHQDLHVAVFWVWGQLQEGLKGQH